MRKRVSDIVERFDTGETQTVTAGTWADATDSPVAAAVAAARGGGGRRGGFVRDELSIAAKISLWD